MSVVVVAFLPALRISEALSEAAYGLHCRGSGSRSGEGRGIGVHALRCMVGEAGRHVLAFGLDAVRAYPVHLVRIGGRRSLLGGVAGALALEAVELRGAHTRGHRILG